MCFHHTLRECRLLQLLLHCGLVSPSRIPPRKPSPLQEVRTQQHPDPRLLTSRDPSFEWSTHIYIYRRYILTLKHLQNDQLRRPQYSCIRIQTQIQPIGMLNKQIRRQTVYRPCIQKRCTIVQFVRLTSRVCRICLIARRKILEKNCRPPTGCQKYLVWQPERALGA